MWPQLLFKRYHNYHIIPGPQLPYEAMGHSMVTVNNNVFLIIGYEIMMLEFGKSALPELFGTEYFRGMANMEMIFFEENGLFQCWWSFLGKMIQPRFV